MSFGWMVVLPIGAYALWRLFRHRDTKTAGTIRGPGTFACDVVGESKYQVNLEHIADGRSEDSTEVRKQALLVLEDDNRHDSNAVCVRIDGLRVGYLSREMARGYRSQLKKQGIPLANYWCEAAIVGGWDRGPDDRGHFGVRLDVPVDD
jgi:hypothetical protein